jgi:hypothetical protein
MTTFVIIHVCYEYPNKSKVSSTLNTADSKNRKNGKKAEPNDPAPAYGYLGKSYAPFSILHPWHVPGVAA